MRVIRLSARVGPLGRFDSGDITLCSREELALEGTVSLAPCEIENEETFPPWHRPSQESEYGYRYSFDGSFKLLTVSHRLASSSVSFLCCFSEYNTDPTAVSRSSLTNRCTHRSHNCLCLSTFVNMSLTLFSGSVNHSIRPYLCESWMYLFSSSPKTGHFAL